MLQHTTKIDRAESARINGAKSKGPKTPEGLHRARTASLKHGLYATRTYLLPGEPPEEFAELRAQLLAYWQPVGFYPRSLVERLAGNLWESTRAQGAKTDYFHDVRAGVAQAAPRLRDNAKLNMMAHNRALVEGGTLDRAHACMAHLSRERDKLERSLLRLEKRPATSGPSQKLLEINGQHHPDIPATDDPETRPGHLSEGPYITKAAPEPEPPSQPDVPEKPEEEPGNILTWADAALDFKPDPFQAALLTETNTRMLVLAPRQTGKSTAAAVRVLFEAMSHEDAVILLASASGRQSGQIMQKALQMARKIDVKILPPPPKCDGFSLANGSQVIALPDSQETIRGFSAPRLIVVDEAAFCSEEVFKALDPMLTVSAGTIMLLSTPNGQTGYFYEQWHHANTPWTRLQSTLADCPRVDQATIQKIRQTMSKDDFQQEFECKFIAAGGQFISRETFRKCLRDDFELFFPEDNEDPDCQ